MRIEFLGAAQTVTGSRTLLTSAQKRILVDCGLFQGPRRMRQLNWDPVPNPKDLDAILLTHAHIDHSGLLPRMVRMGFSGPVYCSEGTADLCRILLLDSARLQEEDAEYANKSKYSNHNPALPLYTVQDAEKALTYLEPVERNRWVQLDADFSFQFLRAGHIIGSSLIQVAFTTPENDGPLLLTFTGDLGNGRSPILKSPAQAIETDYLVMESTYGNRFQPQVSPQEEMAEIVNTVCGRGGALIIPAFSVGRTQDVLHLLQTLRETGAIRNVPVYLDSPMAIEATRIFLEHPEDHAPSIKADFLRPPISGNWYTPVRDRLDSMDLMTKPGPMIIISASGMLTGGRVMHHLKSRLPDPRNGVLFTGYQAEGTKGRLLQAGLRELRIHHQPIPVRADVFSIETLSAHADAEDLMNWLRNLKRPPRLVFLNHGEAEASHTLAARIRQELNWPVKVPAQGDGFILGLPNDAP